MTASLFSFLISFTFFSIIFFILTKLYLRKISKENCNNNSFDRIIPTLDDSDTGKYFQYRLDKIYLF